MTQGWDQADYQCGRCGYAFTATTEAEYVNRYSAHQLAHDVLATMSPEQRARVASLLGPTEAPPQ